METNEIMTNEEVITEVAESGLNVISDNKYLKGGAIGAAVVVGGYILTKYGIAPLVRKIKRKKEMDEFVDELSDCSEDDWLDEETEK